MYERKGEMSPTEEEIISRMEMLLDFEYGKGNTQQDLIAWANNVLSAFKIFLPMNSTPVRLLERSLDNYLRQGIYDVTATGNFNVIVRGLLKGISLDYKAGFLKDLRSEIRTEVETDFLSQANRLLDDKYKDSSAMIIGAVLEDTLRQLCQKHGVPEGSNIESMNIPLKKANVYSLTVQKQVTAWAGIRNDADHARFNNYDLSQVKLMHQGVLDFVAKHLT